MAAKLSAFFLIMLTVVSVAYAAVDTGIVNHWPFERNMSDVYRSLNFTGTFTNFTGWNGRTHDFRVGESTVAKPTEIKGTNYTVIFGANVSDATAEGILYWTGGSNGGIQVATIANVVRIWDGDSLNLLTGIATTVNNVWECHAITVNGSDLRYYEDGLNVWNGTAVNQNDAGSITSTGSTAHILDEIGIFDIVKTREDIATYCDNTTFYPFTVAGVFNITGSTFNVTSSDLNNTAWRTNTSFAVPTNDSTPTVTFTVSSASNCSIGLYNQNYSKMVSNNSATRCSTTDTTSHTCTVPSSEAISLGEQNIFIGCGGAGLETSETTAAVSGPLRLNLSSSCSYAQGNWFIRGHDNCQVNSNVIGGGGTLTINGTGSVIVNATISNFSTYLLQGGATVECRNGGCLK